MPLPRDRAISGIFPAPNTIRAIPKITISSGNPVTTSYYGVQLLSPNNNYDGYPVEYTSFSWTPFQETNKYRFTLARKSDMTDILVTVELSDTGYEYTGKLEYGTAYYWQVMALEPAPSDPSAVFSFTTEVQQIQEPVISETPPEASSASEAPPAFG